ncbi:MAG: sirohydrochlorin cobaltochelatase [Deltaproteobacteria bacterium]|jgi:sirohydrochlorin cobaltochelatase|nr:sirohydrochlorin cobaltochelatase [Deltaproteobacteria bacterium]
MFFFILTLSAIFCGLLCASRAARADGCDDAENKLNIPNPSIVLVSSGTTDPRDVKDIMHVESKIKMAFPCYDTHLSFTSREIRQIWRERAQDLNFKKFFPQIDERFYEVKNVLTTLALIQETGPRLILVQSLQLIDCPEYLDLCNLVDSLRLIKSVDRRSIPFPWLGLGSPAMGKGEGQRENLYKVSEALSSLFEEAKAKQAIVVLVTDRVGGVNPEVYRRLEEVLYFAYHVEVFIGIPQARDGFKVVWEKMDQKNASPGPIILAPLSLMVGEEARDDLAGEKEDSWANLFQAKGFTVFARLDGLGGSDSFASIFVDSLKRLEDVVSHRYTSV